MRRLKTTVLSDFLNDLPLGAFITYAYWYAYQKTHDQGIVSLQGTVSMIALLLAVFGGYISDKYSKIKMMRFLIMLRFIFIAIDTIPLKWTIEIHKVFNYSRRWDFLCPEKANTHLNKRNGQLSSI